jgi:hypothetical protein
VSALTRAASKVAGDLAQQKFERRQKIRVRALLSALLSRCGTESRTNRRENLTIEAGSHANFHIPEALRRWANDLVAFDLSGKSPLM